MGSKSGPTLDPASTDGTSRRRVPHSVGVFGGALFLVPDWDPRLEDPGPDLGIRRLSPAILETDSRSRATDPAARPGRFVGVTMVVLVDGLRTTREILPLLAVVTLDQAAAVH